MKETTRVASLADIPVGSVDEVVLVGGSTRIPLVRRMVRKLFGRKPHSELNPDDEIVVHCKMGGRSAKAADFLRSVGFKRVLNLTGGILDWIDKVDPTQPKY
jgi:rhodanese-related sulfurtransferase